MDTKVKNIFAVHCTVYSVMQSDQNSSKTDTFHEPTTYEPHVYNTNSEQIITFARHEYGRVGVFRISKSVIFSTVPI